MRCDGPGPYMRAANPQPMEDGASLYTSNMAENPPSDRSQYASCMAQLLPLQDDAMMHDDATLRRGASVRSPNCCFRIAYIRPHAQPAAHRTIGAMGRYAAKRKTEEAEPKTADVTTIYTKTHSPKTSLSTQIVHVHCEEGRIGLVKINARWRRGVYIDLQVRTQLMTNRGSWDRLRKQVYV